jgi:hypothetical protein
MNNVSVIIHQVRTVPKTNTKHCLSIPETCPTSGFWDCTPWTGGNDLAAEGSYRWQHSDSNLNFSNWYPGEPSVYHYGKEEDCIAILKNGQLNDKECSAKTTFICEKAKANMM